MYNHWFLVLLVVDCRFSCETKRATPDVVFYGMVCPMKSFNSVSVKTMLVFPFSQNKKFEYPLLVYQGLLLPLCYASLEKTKFPSFIKKYFYIHIKLFKKKLCIVFPQANQMIFLKIKLVLYTTDHSNSCMSHSVNGILDTYNKLL